MPGSTFLRGERVTLRTVEEADVDFLCDLVNDPDVWPYLNNHPPRNHVTEREFVEERVTDDESVGLLVCVGEDRTDPAGTVGLDRATPVDGSTEIGVVLAPGFWGEGYGTEASRMLTTYAFEERRTIVSRRWPSTGTSGRAGSGRNWGSERRGACARPPTTGASTWTPCCSRCSNTSGRRETTGRDRTPRPGRTHSPAG